MCHIHSTAAANPTQQGGLEGSQLCPTFISHEVIINSFCKSKFPHELVNLSLSITIIKNKLTDLWGNGLVQNDFAIFVFVR
jgi:hypothetical protein